MTYLDAIKQGFALIRKNWQLVLIQIILMIISLFGFFIFIFIPLGIALAAFGIDLTELTRLGNMLETMTDPSDIIARYAGIIIVFIASLLFYIMAATCLWLYVFGGSAGYIGKALRDSSLKFSMNIFFSEAKHLFFPLMWFTAIVGLIFIGIAFVLGIFGGVIAAIIGTAKSQEAAVLLFIGIFAALILFCIALFLLIAALALTMYGIAAIVFKGYGAWKATKDTVKYLFHQPRALWLYALLFAGYVGASFLLILLGVPFNLIPVVGAIIAIPYQIFSSIVQSYLWLVIIAALFIYYCSTDTVDCQIKGTNDGSSTQKTETSLPQA